MSSAIYFDLDKSKILLSSNGLTEHDEGTTLSAPAVVYAFETILNFIFFFLTRYYTIQSFNDLRKKPFYTTIEDGTYYMITRGRQPGSVPHCLSGAYLQDYAS